MVCQVSGLNPGKRAVSTNTETDLRPLGSSRTSVTGINSWKYGVDAGRLDHRRSSATTFAVWGLRV